MKCKDCVEWGSEFCKDCLIEAVNAPKWKRAGPNGELEIKFPTGRRFKVEKQLDHNERHRGEWKVMEYKPGGVDNWEWVDTYSPKGFAKQKAMMLGQYDKRDKKVADYSKTFQYESVMHEEATVPHPEVVKAYKKTLDAEDKAAEYNHRGNKARVTRASNHLGKMIAKHHPGLDSKGKIAIRTKLQNMSESSTPMRTLKLIDKIKKSGVVKSGSMKKEEMTTTASIPNPATTAMGPRFKAHNVTDRRRRKDKTPVVLKRFRKYMDDK